VNLFATSPGDPDRREPSTVSVDLSRWAGHTVRLRLATTDNRGPLRAGVDDIRFEPIRADAKARIELPHTAEPARAVDLVLHRMTQADALKALSARADKLAGEGQFSGAVLVAKDGRVLFRHAYGLADRNRRIANTIRTRFRIGSMNKMFTAVAILQLVQAGKLKLTAPLGTYLRDYPNREVATKVTIHQLLTTRAARATSSAPTSTPTATTFARSPTTSSSRASGGSSSSRAANGPTATTASSCSAP
jgi:CubicO group peptidase (beta-lactamase class C family)